MQDEMVVVIAGGERPRPEAVRAIGLWARVLAADSGLAHARALGLDVEAVIGDLDSASPEDVEDAVSRGARIERHPTEKDATDLELALDAALALAPTRILVLAGTAGRLDHLFSTLLLLGSARYAGVQLDAEIGPAHVHVIRRERVLDGEPGELVSLFALNGPARGVTTEGLVYPLSRETLEPGSSRGVSNLFAGKTARVSVERGVLVAIRPGSETEGDAG
jgi:thiamine pyrophosphokinase